MGTAYFASTNDIVTALSVRAVVGAMLALFLIILATALFRRADNTKELLYTLIAGVVISTTIVLLITSLYMISLPTFALIRVAIR